MLDAAPVRHKRGESQALEALKVKERGTEPEVLELMVRETSWQFPPGSRLATAMNLSRARAEYLIEKLRAARRILILADGSVIHMDYWNEIAAFAEELLVVYHRENPISEGMDKEEFKSRLNEQFAWGISAEPPCFWPSWSSAWR